MEINNYRYMQQIEGRNESLNTLINTGLITNLVSQYIQYETCKLLEKNAVDSFDMETMYFILYYSNIAYENLDKNILPLEDGVYDLLREKYINNGGIPPVGGVPLKVQTISEQVIDNQITDYITPAKFVNHILEDGDLLYTDMLLHKAPITKNMLMVTPAIFAQSISKRTRTTSHEFPDLVGTLNKCKFVMKYQALDKGVLNDDNVKVLERDFFGDHIKKGILQPERIFSMVLMLKFDGVSVEGDVVNGVYTSRGDAIGGVAADLTPILRNYRFPNQPQFSDNESIGVQFEAIMSYTNLYRYNQARGYNYKNCRTAISGLFSSSDAYKYMDYVTLVPLASSINVSKDVELEFLNKYYTRGIYNTYTVITGNVTTILYQIKKFVEEAELMRDYIDFQYDGVVVQYLDEDLIKALGRANAINNYAMAIKFNPLKKQTVFLGYTYTVGQDGYITPMIHYKPVEFMGTIHPKSSGHSLDRFLELGLRIGDIIDIEYVNDVMPYVTKPENSHNEMNENPLELFPTQCPICGTTISISRSGKSAYCPNIDCDGRKIARVVNMLDKLGFRDFAEASVEKLKIRNLYNLMSMDYYAVKQSLGSDILAAKFIEQQRILYNANLWDYEIMGSIGFDSIAKETWKLVLREVQLSDVVDLSDEVLYSRLIQIKGIGPTKAAVIVDRREYFTDDMVCIINGDICSKESYGIMPQGKKIRFTGFRDKELVDTVNALGHEMSDSSVTKDTNIVIVVNQDAIDDVNSRSGKVKAALKYGIPIVTLQDFKDNMDVYLGE